MRRTTKLLICIALCGVIYLCTPSARACRPPGPPCHNWDTESETWEPYGCVATPCTEPEDCNDISCECEPTCVDPNAVFAVDPNVVVIGATITFDGSESSDPDGTDLVYSWSLGTYAFDISGADTETASARYLCTGLQEVSLTVTDNDDPNCCSDCSDANDVETQSLTVYLPDGCSDCGMGEPEISLEVDDQNVEYPPACDELIIDDDAPAAPTDVNVANKFLEYAQNRPVYQAWLDANKYYHETNARCIVNENNLNDTLKVVTRDKPTNNYKYYKMELNETYSIHPFTLP